MSKNFMILITFLAKKMLLRLAYIFGKISPQSKMKKVTNPTSQITLNQLLNPLKRNSPIGAKISTIDIFTKLLAISIVANNFLGFFSILTISLLVLLSLSSSLFKSVWERENNATSAPEIRAEQQSKIKNIIVRIINSDSVKKLGGSQSKIC